MSRSTLWLAAALAVGLPSCVGDDVVEDPANDTFTDGAGKADGYGLSDAEVAAVLELVNGASRATLVGDVGLSDRVAKGITKHRAGADAKLGTADDDLFGDLPELDAVPYVGKRVFAALLDYVRAHQPVCKAEHAGKTPSGVAVQICDALYDQAPFVHVPADHSAGATLTTYGAILNGVGLVLYTADGRVLSLVNASGQAFPIGHGPTGFKAPENLFAIYEVTGTKGTAADSLVVRAVTPIAWVPGAVQDKRLLGTWEAQASGRTGTNKFDRTHPVAIRFTLTSTTDNTPMWKNLGGGDGLITVGSIDNFDKRVEASDGSCLASLASLGASSPFYQATQNRITLWRHPNMHGLNDQVVVMDYPTGSANLSMNGMGWIVPFSVAGLVQVAGPGTSETEIRPHATPNGHLVWGFTKVDAGGAACP